MKPSKLLALVVFKNCYNFRKSGKTGNDAEKYQMRKESDVYKKTVYWSDEDSCFIGMCPELMYGGVQGEDALKVFIELNEVVEEVAANSKGSYF